MTTLYKRSRVVLAIHTISRPLVDTTNETISYRCFAFTSTPKDCPTTAEEAARIYVPLPAFKNYAATCFFHHLHVREFSAAAFFHPESTGQHRTGGSPDVQSLPNFQEIFPSMLAWLN
mmetsp:Transcript_65206/g.175045  ORF Transcript_65206/g.175045 Transcript_65206/m.175045 type:complete len:118 (+) Transcript_65206:82-435(+)